MIYFAILFATIAAAQDAGERVTVPFSDPSRPKIVKGSLINACFTVEGYDGKEVVLEAKGSGGHRLPRGVEGMKRIDSNGFGLTLEEENNTVRIHGPATGSTNVMVRVPRDVALNLQCVNGGQLKVTGVSGDLELSNTNGNVSATNVSGSVLAHSLNGKVVVSLDRITADKPMSFSTLNGDIDVTLPAGTRATLRLKSDNGEIFTDFEMRLNPTASQPTVDETRGKSGRYRGKMEKAMVGSINGGGPDMTFKTLNGNIFVHQRK